MKKVPVSDPCLSFSLYMVVRTQHRVHRGNTEKWIIFRYNVG